MSFFLWSTTAQNSLICWWISLVFGKFNANDIQKVVDALFCKCCFNIRFLVPHAYRNDPSTRKIIIKRNVKERIRSKCYTLAYCLGHSFLVSPLLFEFYDFFVAQAIAYQYAQLYRAICFYSNRIHTMAFQFHTSSHDSAPLLHWLPNTIKKDSHISGEQRIQ